MRAKPEKGRLPASRAESCERPTRSRLAKFEEKGTNAGDEGQGTGAGQTVERDSRRGPRDGWSHVATAAENENVYGIRRLRKDDSNNRRGGLAAASPSDRVAGSTAKHGRPQKAALVPRKPERAGASCHYRATPGFCAHDERTRVDEKDDPDRGGPAIVVVRGCTMAKGFREERVNRHDNETHVRCDTRTQDPSRATAAKAGSLASSLNGQARRLGYGHASTTQRESGEVTASKG